jgi:hypothetical protein
VERSHRASHALVFVRVFRRQPRGDGGDLLSGALERDSRLQTSDHVQVPGAAALRAEASVVLERTPDLRTLRVREAGGRHAHDKVRLPVHLHGLADEAGIAAEAIAPEPLTKDDDLRVTGLVVTLLEPAAERRPHAQNVEERRAHLRSLDTSRRSLAGEGHAGAVDRRQQLESLRLRLDVEEVLRRVDGRLALPDLVHGD